MLMPLLQWLEGIVIKLIVMNIVKKNRIDYNAATLAAILVLISLFVREEPLNTVLLLSAGLVSIMSFYYSYKRNKREEEKKLNLNFTIAVLLLMCSVMLIFDYLR